MAVLKGIHHVAVAVDDLDEAIETYGRLFGAELEHRDTVNEQGVEAAAVLVGESRIELLDHEPRRGLYGMQVAFVHPSSVDGVLSELVSHGR